MHVKRACKNIYCTCLTKCQLVQSLVLFFNTTWCCSTIVVQISFMLLVWSFCLHRIMEKMSWFFLHNMSTSLLLVLISITDTEIIHNINITTKHKLSNLIQLSLVSLKKVKCFGTKKVTLSSVSKQTWKMRLHSHIHFKMLIYWNKSCFNF